MRALVTTVAFPRADLGAILHFLDNAESQSLLQEPSLAHTGSSEPV